MCGRFTLTSDMDSLLFRFAAVLFDSKFDYLPRYNIAPTQTVIGIIKKKEQNIIYPFRWGLIPFWSKDERIGAKMINARSETITEKPSFKNLLKRQRCLIPATGFYEWQKNHSGKGKQPVYIQPHSNKVIAFAGLWDSWQAPNDQLIHSCTIITTKANEMIYPVHHRMPVILTQEAEQAWLDPAISDNKTLLALLQPADDSLLTMYRVSPNVNSPRNDTPECIVPLNDRMKKSH